MGEGMIHYDDIMLLFLCSTAPSFISFMPVAFKFFPLSGFLFRSQFFCWISLYTQWSANCLIHCRACTAVLYQREILVYFHTYEVPQTSTSPDNVRWYTIRRTRNDYQIETGILIIPLIWSEYSDDVNVLFTPFPYLDRNHLGIGGFILVVKLHKVLLFQRTCQSFFFCLLKQQFRSWSSSRVKTGKTQ